MSCINSAWKEKRWRGESGEVYISTDLDLLRSRLGQMYEMKVKSQYHSASLKRVSTLDNNPVKANMYEQPKKTRVDEGKCEAGDLVVMGSLGLPRGQFQYHDSQKHALRCPHL